MHGYVYTVYCIECEVEEVNGWLRLVDRKAEEALFWTVTDLAINLQDEFTPSQGLSWCVLLKHRNHLELDPGHHLSSGQALVLLPHAYT